MAESSMDLSADHAEDPDTALENAWSPCAASIALYRQLKQKYNSIPSEGPSHDARIGTLRSDLIASQRDSAHHSPRVDACKNEVERIEAALMEAKTRLEEEQSQLARSNAQCSEIESQLQNLEQEKKQKEDLERQMLVKQKELNGLLMIAKQFNERYGVDAGTVTVDPSSPPPSASLLDTVTLASETLQNITENKQSTAAGLENQDVSTSISAYNGYEWIYPDVGGKDDPDYVNSDADTDADGSVENAFESQRVFSKPPGECLRCIRHGYDCVKQKKGNTGCIRCQDDDAACSLKRPRRGRHRGRQPDEKLNSRLRYLLEERRLDFPTIVKMDVFEGRTEVALRQRWRRLKKRESEGGAPQESERNDIWNLEPTPPSH